MPDKDFPNAATNPMWRKIPAHSFRNDPEPAREARCQDCSTPSVVA